MSVGRGPRYRQIADDLEARITSGEFPPGTHLPAEPDLAHHYDVGMNTIRRAIQTLREDGLVVTRHGDRSRVADFAEKTEIVVPAGSKIEARPARTADRVKLEPEWGELPPHWPILQVTYPDGSGDIFPAHRVTISLAE
ncbi:winged helix-turn-helix domain-containing protein [Polymorphospora lycopeni]|uniref:Winged helix-turn-helix domain-containing protein n=1 Tax=Polymorphospora lycopeni TaxID=3140240 RepID=A0ABV5D2G3_9ACTN